MSDAATSATESEANQTPPGGEGAGSAGDGSGGASGSQSSAGTPANDEVAQIEARRRALQSENDRLKNELAAARAAKEGDGQAPAPALTEDRILALMRQEREMARAESSFKEQYKLADPELFERTYPSVEAFEAAVKSSHERVSSLVNAGRSEQENALLARYREAYGELDATPPDSNGGTATGDPTFAQLEAMSLSELDALEAANPGVIDRVKRSALGG